MVTFGRCLWPTIFAVWVATQLTSALVDNGILGDPYVSCGIDAIEVRFDTRNTFRGLVFVQNHLEDPDCRSAPVNQSGLTGGARNTQIRLNFKACGLEKKRTTNPKGLLLTTSLIVAFHPEFLTKFDRVYTVQCYYMEAESDCGKEILVKMPPPVLHTSQVPMPVCRYEVLEGGPNGPPVFFATIGQMVYHKWTCESEAKDQFCMIVHNCIVDDGNGDRVELIDEKGCARDKFLLQNLDYVSDLLVGKEAHVYKYADRPSMFFDCQITLTIKEPGQEFCDVPNCPDPPRRRRLATEEYILQTTPKTEVEAANSKASEDAENEVAWPKCVSALGVGSMTAINFGILGASGLLFRNALKSY